MIYDVDTPGIVDYQGTEYAPSGFNGTNRFDAGQRISRRSARAGELPQIDVPAQQLEPFQAQPIPRHTNQPGLSLGLGLGLGFRVGVAWWTSFAEAENNLTVDAKKPLPSRVTRPYFSETALSFYSGTCACAGTSTPAGVDEARKRRTLLEIKTQGTYVSHW